MYNYSYDQNTALQLRQMYIGWQWCWPVVYTTTESQWMRWLQYIKPATMVPQKEPCLCFKTPEGIPQLKEQNGGWPPSVYTWPSASLSVKNAELVEATVHRSQEYAGVCPCALL